MASVKQRALEVMEHFVDIGVEYDWYGAGHSRSEWNDRFALSDGTLAYGPTKTDCSGGIICAYENADPGCTGGASDTGDMKSCFLSTDKWEWHDAGDGYRAQPGDVYLYSKYLHSDAGQTAMCYSSTPDLMTDVYPDYARIVNYYNYGRDGWDGTLVYIGSGSTSTGGDPGTGAIAEDGYWGKGTTAALQRHYGAVVDGEVWHQWAPNVQANPCLTSGWMCDDTLLGSPVIKAIQGDLGVTVDGIMGPNTIAAIYNLFGGAYGHSSTLTTAAVWEIQHQLNGGIWPTHL